MQVNPKDVQLWLKALYQDQYELYLSDHGPVMADRMAKEAVAKLRKFIGVWVRLAKGHFPDPARRRLALEMAWAGLFSFMKKQAGKEIVFPTSEELAAIEREWREK
ncbi:MAG: hypothetical protein HY794_13385 [Desulfarculus sp.]|nr:hypothetical protein [Desulfarculus sp.]